MEILTFLLLSLGAGALIATMALSLVLTFRASGVINFAAGATAAFIAYAYWDLTSRGRLFIGVEIPLTSDGSGINGWLAVLICLGIAAALGYLQYLLVYRPLRNAGALAKVVASSGVLLVLQSLVVLAFGSDTRVVSPLLPQTPLAIGGLSLPLDRVIILALALIAAAALTFVYRRTSFGIKTRAAADNRKGALLLGVNPGKLEAINWVVASVITGLIGVLVSPLIGLQPTAMSLFIVSALSAVLLAGFSSFWVAALAGIGIGMAQALITFAQGFDWFPTVNNAPLPGVKEVLPFLIIAVVLFVRGRNLPDRLTEAQPRLPRAPRPRKLLIRFSVAIVLGMAIITFAPYGWRQALITSLIGAIVCMSIVVITGYLGQVTLGQMAIAGIAGFVVSKLALNAGIGFPFGAVLAVLVAAAVSLLVALPALRMRGMQLAVVTLAGAVAIQSLWFRNPEWGGGTTAASVPAPEFLGIKLGTTDSFWNMGSSVPTPGFALFILIVACLVALFVVTVRRSSLGARMLAVRANEAAAAAAGVSVVTTKLLAFGIAGLIAGIAGTLYGYNFGLVTATRFDEFTAISFLAIAYLGGITTVSGAVIGGLLVTQGVMMYTITNLLNIDSAFQTLIAGVAVLATVVGNPDGIAGFFRDKFARRSAKRRLRAAPAAAPAVRVGA
ncbi:ABC transporter permease [Herbiconiux sp. KACC 21604]|uniref:ABC transporter permease n=1 Tax=unclassified Herbiconiux TaxID=2618217 RepID=UPI0014929A21|nr:ABC transporter permease [Herbiconiux sp. SALV-R1]QJU55650.1 ABC transporter permease [Herbiconiux sp. SALV-R1]WPO86850.1 ABC transporter permease [Herbiconiux sp. KACC 21604]